MKPYIAWSIGLLMGASISALTFFIRIAREGSLGESNTNILNFEIGFFSVLLLLSIEVLVLLALPKKPSDEIELVWRITR